MITKNFIHIHIPKTGGQQIRLLISHSGMPILDQATNRNIKECYEIMSRLAPDMDPASMPIFCFVRNPWDWYVSRYFFRNQRDRSQDAVAIPADTCGEGVEGFQKHMRLLKASWESGDPVLNEFGKPAGTDYAPIMLSGWHEMRLDGVRGPMRVGRFENFTEDTVTIFRSLSGVSRDKIMELIMARVNASRHDKYRDYYDDELKTMVAEWDADYIEKFGYRF